MTAASNVERWLQLRAGMLDLRGYDQTASRGRAPGTTVADVKQLAVLWTCAAASAELPPSDRWSWRAALDRVAEVAAGLPLDIRYPDNEQFWQRDTWRLALALDDRRALGYRNGRLTYRPVGGKSGDPYPEWLRALKGQSGVYAIRERDHDGEPVVVYVGESHTGRLYETLTRHLQDWRRYKGFWSGQYGKGHDPGLTYDRGSVEVAVRLTHPDDAIDEEARLIRRLRPRDNLLGQPEPEEVPF